MLAEEIKDDNFAIKGCWEVLLSSTGVLVIFGSLMESSAEMVLFHPILIGVQHVGEAGVVVVAMVGAVLGDLVIFECSSDSSAGETSIGVGRSAGLGVEDFFLLCEMRLQGPSHGAGASLPLSEPRGGS